MVRLLQAFAALAGACWFVTASFAQDARPVAAAADAAPAGEHAAPVLGAVRIEASQRPTVDGRLDEAVWAEAPAATGFVQLQPDAGQPASERTVAHVLYDGSALYVAFRAYVRDPETVVAPLSRRDQFVVTDRVLVQVDSYFDRRTAFEFAVTAAGVQQDGLLYNDTDYDANWDAVWSAATDRTADGWTAELRIPLSQLRFRTGEGPQPWGVQFQRSIIHNGEESYWAPVIQGEDRFVSRFGTLEGLSGLVAPNGLEVEPYVASRLTREPGDAADPFYDENAMVGSVGADVKYGLTSNLTLTATINPDFGQVEADPAIVNLSAFEPSFEERRPFFVEGTDIFGYGRTRSYRTRHNPTFFYSRRIGRQPASLGAVYGDGIDYAYADGPDQTTIATAAKLSGKIGGWSVGALDAVTTPEHARFLGTDGREDEALVEPWANYFVGRVKRDFRGGQTVLGGLATTVHRDASDDAFDPLLHRSAYVGGVDFEHAWAGRQWTVSGVATGSRVAGDPARLLATQRASRRYFQRPDADYLALDPEATSLSGYFTELSLAKTSGAHWTGSVTGSLISPGFEVNDLGFQSRADARTLSAQLNYQETDPKLSWLRNYRVYGFTIQSWNYGGQRFDAFYGLHGRTVFSNLWTLDGRVFLQPETYDDRLTRGGPVARQPATQNAYTQIFSDRRKPVYGDVFVLGRWDDSGRFERTVNVGLTARPTPSLELTLAPGFSHLYGTRQYITARTEEGAATEATFGRRYVFSNVEQRILSLETRLNWTFTPDLSLQLYLRPFIAAVDFSDFKEFTAPGTFDFDVYGVDKGTITEQEDGSYLIAPGDGEPLTLRDPDFNNLSLQGNMVLRWEYRPGSALFFVWQQQRFGYEPDGEFGLERGFDGIVNGDVYNVFLVKATYWLGL